MQIEVKFSVTDSAVDEFKKALPDQDSLIRISAKSSGCSGTSYGLGVVDSSDIDNSQDVLEEFGGIKFVADKGSAMQLDGVTLDWQSIDGQEGFKFINPNVSGCCRKGGCSS